jgi:hypothetical protein
MPNGFPKRGTMREENPTTDHSTGSQAEQAAKVSNRPTGFLKNSPFDIVALYEHDYREVDGKRVHGYRCRRCALTVRLNGLRNQVEALIRDVKQAVGEMRDG